jgi:uncharacterized protein with gpF-like domain
MLVQRERRTLTRVRRIRHALERDVSDTYLAGSSDMTTVFAVFQRRMELALRQTSEATATLFGVRVLRQYAPRKDTQDFFIEAVRRWILAHSASRAVTITMTQRETVMTALLEAERQGLGRREVVRVLRSELQLTRWQIDRIARTETHTASQVGASEAARALDVPLMKDWISAEDARTRSNHAAMDTLPPIPLDEPFPNGLMYPGDPAGAASEVINCRCVVAYVPATGGSAR